MCNICSQHSYSMSNSVKFYFNVLLLLPIAIPYNCDTNRFTTKPFQVLLFYQDVYCIVARNLIFC